MKKCKKCKQEKLLTEFSSAKRNKDGKHSYCKECVRERGRNYNVTGILGRDWKLIEKEISLCEVRCANCHKMKTAERRLSQRIKCLQELAFLSRWTMPVVEVSISK